MRILLIGSAGMLGSDLAQGLDACELIPATSRDADIRDLAQVRRLVSASAPDWILLAGGYTDVDGAERDPDLAFAVNRDGTRNVAVAAKQVGAKLLYVSTDYVFDGKSNRAYEPNDPINPLNAYGASKAAGEHAVQEFAGEWLTARTSWLFGASRTCFPEKILRAADAQPELKVVIDQVGSPTYTKDLAAAIRQLIHADASGILHVTNSGSCSWFDFAKEVLRKAGKTTAISAISTPETDRPAKRPAYSVLSPAALATYGIKLRSWQDALDTYLCELHDKGKLR